MVKACKEPFSYCAGITEYTLPQLREGRDVVEGLTERFLRRLTQPCLQDPATNELRIALVQLALAGQDKQQYLPIRSYGES